MGIRSSAFAVDTDVNTNSFTGGSPLASPIEVTKENLEGTSGLYRIYFAISGDDYTLSVDRTPNGKGATFEGVITNGELTSITVTNTGAGYEIVDDTPLLLVITGGGGTATAEAVISRTEIISATILSSDSNFTSKPTITIADTGSAEVTFKFNGDNDFVLKDGGYYRFDINVRAGDAIDFTATSELDALTVSEFRIDQIQLGA